MIIPLFLRGLSSWLFLFEKSGEHLLAALFYLLSSFVFLFSGFDIKQIKSSYLILS